MMMMMIFRGVKVDNNYDVVDFLDGDIDDIDNDDDIFYLFNHSKITLNINILNYIFFSQLISYGIIF